MTKPHESPQDHEIGVEETFRLLSWESPYKVAPVRWEAGQPVRGVNPAAFVVRVSGSTSTQ